VVPHWSPLPPPFRAQDAPQSMRRLGKTSLLSVPFSLLPHCPAMASVFFSLLFFRSWRAWPNEKCKDRSTIFFLLPLCFIFSDYCSYPGPLFSPPSMTQLHKDSSRSFSPSLKGLGGITFSFSTRFEKNDNLSFLFLLLFFSLRAVAPAPACLFFPLPPHSATVFGEVGNKTHSFPLPFFYPFKASCAREQVCLPSIGGKY